MAELCAGNFVCAVCNDLVGVHVGLRAGTRLPYHEREVGVQLAGNDLVACLGNYVELFGCHLCGLQLTVGNGSCLFEYSEGVDDLLRHGLDTNADVEVLMASFGLCRPVYIGGNLDFAHRIVFDTVFHFSSLFLV